MNYIKESFTKLLIGSLSFLLFFTLLTSFVLSKNRWKTIDVIERIIYKSNTFVKKAEIESHLGAKKNRQNSASRLSNTYSNTNELIPSGSYIINMGVQPQTVNNALKPYGMIWELLHDHLVPIKWAIKSDKGKDGVDFTYNGVSYRGGPFIISEEYRTAAVNAVINKWKSKGVIGVTTNSDFTAPIDRTINYSMNWTLDHENGDIAEKYLESAEIPESAYNWVLPQNLNCCNDVFLMPHAHPDWNSHKNLLYWNDSPANDGCSGAIWAGCKAVSELENIYNPSNPSEKLNFLMQDAPGNTPAVWSDDHEDGDGNYQHALHDQPIMQFMGKLDGAQENGAEQIYLPTVGWRPTTQIGVWEANHEDVPSLSPGQAAKLAFGYAFGDTNRGYVGYEAGHKVNKDSNPASIAAQRAFLNFSFRAVEDKAIKPLAVVPATMTTGASYNLTSSASGGSGNYVFKWTSSCGGTFSNRHSSTTTFIAPSVTNDTECILTLIITDDCGTRTGFNRVQITISSGPAPPVAEDDNKNTSPCTAVTINALSNDYDPENEPLILTLTGSTNTGDGLFVNNNDGTVTYMPNAGFSGTDQITYQICDPTALCDNATITVNVSSNQPPLAIDDVASTPEGTPVLVDVKANDADPEGGILSLNIQTVPTNGSVAVQNGKILYTPNFGFTGTDQFDYQICDNACVPLCDIATVTISIACDPIPGEVNMLGTVFSDQNGNGILESGEEGQDAVEVNLYQDNNGDGQVDGGDTFLESQTTNIGGAYQFTVTSLASSSPTTTNRTVSASADDSFELSNGTNVTNDYENDGDDIATKGFRFQNLNIPSGAVITNAVLTLTAFSGNRATTVDVRAHDLLAPPAYSSSNNYLTNLYNSSATSNVVSWSIPEPSDGDALNSPNLSTVLQEVVDSYSGMTHLSLLVSRTNSGDYILWNYDDGTASRYPRLSVTYTVPVTTNFVMQVNQSTLPSNTNMTTDNVETASFSSLGQIDCSNNFGFQYSTPQPPVAEDDTENTSACTAVTIDILVNDSDPEGEALTITSVGSGTNGTFVNNGDGTVTYTPNIGFSGTDVVSYTVCDPDALCDNANISVAVSPNQAPNAEDDMAYGAIDAPVTIDVLVNDADPENEDLTISILTLSTNGTATVVNGQIEFNPNIGFVGQTTFTYEACDDACAPLCDPATVTIEIGCIPIAGQSDIFGTVFLDEDGDGVAADSEIGQNDITVNLFHDLNGDGLLDGGDTLVASQETGANGGYQFSLTDISSGNGSGGSSGGSPVSCSNPTFADQAVISTTAIRANSVYTIDVDGDGDVDALSASFFDDKIAWYENDGTGNFTERIISTTADFAFSVFAEDVDGDGDIDVLSASSDDNKVAWYENDGNENFTERIISTTASQATNVYAIDVDSDGDMDVISTEGDKIAWYENDGNENFTEQTIISASNGFRSLYAIDMDNDGDIDVLSADYIADEITWYENDGSENFTEQIISTTADGARHVYATDVDGDGDIDVLSASNVDNKVAWYENDGNENFTEQIISTTANGANSVYALDMDGDGDIDVLSSSSNDDKVAWYENDGTENFTEVTISVLANNVKEIYAADMDGDGDIDVLSASETDNKIAWYENDCAQQTPPPVVTCSGTPTLTEQVISTNADGAQDVYAIDMDGDGDIDILSASRVDDKIAWYENDGSENFTEQVISTTANEAYSVYAIDMDGDGDIDVLSTSSLDDKVAWYENDGSQNFTEQVISTNADSPRNVYAIDMDGDGDIDVLSASEGDAKIAWYENDGSENFTEQIISTNAGQAYEVYAIDMDGDGDIDVLSASSLNNKIAWYENDGSENFTEQVISTNAAGAVDVYAIDVDGDGDIDVLSASWDSDKVAWYENDGSENFTEQVISTTADNVRSVHAVDMDGDGDIDILSASFTDAKVTWYENDGSENFTEQVISTTAAGASSIYAIDMDGDGAIDVLSASRNADKIAWYENDCINLSSNSSGNYIVVIDTSSLMTNTDMTTDTSHIITFSGLGEVDCSNDFGFYFPNRPPIAVDDDRITEVNIPIDIEVLENDYDLDGDNIFIGTNCKPLFTENNLFTTASGESSVYSIDVDGDGDIDILSAGYGDSRVVWYENDGSENFTEQVISTTSDGESSIYAIDVDGDGDMDVLSASRNEDKIAWYENDGSENFTENIISTTANGAQSVYATDVDGDGDIDVLSASYFDDRISWYENDGGENFTENIISTTADGAWSVYAIDIDGDGDMDVLSASFLDDKIAWYENDGNENFTEQVISTTADEATSVYTFDLDEDGDIDVLSTSRNDVTIAWYENDGSENFTKRVISITAGGARSVYAIDIDVDGDMDVLSGSSYGDNIAWYENDGNENFTENIISNNLDEASSVYAIDIDGDGDMELIGTSGGEGKIVWYDNSCDPATESYLVSAPTQGGTVVLNDNGSAFDPTDDYFEYTPPLNFVGTDVFEYSICDIATPSLCDTATVTVVIEAVNNNPPVAQNDYDTLVVNSEIYTDVLDNDFDQEQGELTANIDAGLLQPANGSIAVAGDNKILYTPNYTFTGDDSYEYIVCDDGTPSYCDTATVFIHVLNRPPDAKYDYRETEIDVPLNIDILVNDREPDGHDIILTSAGTDVANGATVHGGTAVINNNGTPVDYTDDYVFYTPATGFYGLDTFYYEVIDSGTPTMSDQAMVVIRVTPLIDLELEKSVSPEAIAAKGEQVTFTLKLVNKGPSTATEALVRDKLPASYAYVSDNANGLYDPYSGVWYVPILNSEDSITLNIVATVVDGTNLINLTEVIDVNQKDIDSAPANDDGDQSEDDESAAAVIFECSIGDEVWLDLNANTIYDTPEIGIENMQVCVTNQSTIVINSRTYLPGAYLDTVLTDINGNYNFANLPGGTWQIKVLNNPTEYIPTYDADGGILNITDFMLFEGSIFPVNNPWCPNLDCVLELDFGLRLPGALNLSGHVCIDDGSHDGTCGTGGENQLEAIEVHLYDGNRRYFGGVSTAMNGEYLFPYLPNDDYIVYLNTIQQNLNTYHLTTTAEDTPASSINKISNNILQPVEVIADVSGVDYAFVLLTTEVCDNGIDDDGDGLIDCTDPDCGAPNITNVSPTNPNNCPALDNGSIVINATGSNLEYSIDNGLNYQPSSTFSGLIAGIYSIRVKNSISGCEDTDSATLTNSTCNEICDNGIDDDGDGLIDCADNDCDAYSPFTLRDDNFESCPGFVIERVLNFNDIVSNHSIYTLSQIPSRGVAVVNENGRFVYTSFIEDCIDDSFSYQVCDTITGCCEEAMVFIDLSDDEAPNLYNVPDDETIHCDELLATPPLVSAADNCPRISIDVTEESTQGEDGCSLYDYTLTRTWVATDACGNTTSDSQIVEVQDVTAPDIFRIYTLPNGKKLVAGVMENVNQNWKTISLPIDFPTTPLVFTQVVTMEENTAVITRIRNVSNSQFDLKLQEEDAQDNRHIRESVAWMAIEAGNQSDAFLLEARRISLTDAWKQVNFEENYTSLPSFFGEMQTINDSDPAALRFDDPMLNSIQVQIEEETSTDANISHSLEQTAFLGVEHEIDLVTEKGYMFGETGSVSVNEEWIEVSLNNKYYNPVVITGIPQKNETDPGTVRVRNVTPNSFEIRFQEWNYLDGLHANEFIPYLVMEGSLPLDIPFFCNTNTDSLTIGIDIVAIDNCDNNISLEYTERDSFAGAAIYTLRNWTAIDECGNATSLQQELVCKGIALQAKTVLQGAMINNNNDGLMRDDLRRKGYLPTEEPYTELMEFDHFGEGGGESANPTLFDIEGANAVVDWLLLELRPAATPGVVLATQSVLLTRDGDIINATGDTTIIFSDVPPGDYYVAVKHRNHLPMMTLYPYRLDAVNIPNIDFSFEFTPIIGKNSTVTENGKRAHWSGDLNGDGKIIYQGPNNDLFRMFIHIILDDDNKEGLTNYITRGYTANDFNLDGTVIYQGPNNDRSSLLWKTIINHPDNESNLSNFIIQLDLPEGQHDTIPPTQFDEETSNPLDTCNSDLTVDACDFDQDGLNNEVDTDDDGDGVADTQDVAPYDPNSDSDGDGFTDIEETQGIGQYSFEIKSDPLSACDPIPNNDCMDFQTIAAGNWNNPAIWAAGIVPPLKLDRQNVLIKHPVIIRDTFGEEFVSGSQNKGDLELKNGSILHIKNTTLTLNRGHLKIKDYAYILTELATLHLKAGNYEIANNAFVRMVHSTILLDEGKFKVDKSTAWLFDTKVVCSGDLEQQNEASYLFMENCQVSVNGKFKKEGGITKMKEVCLNIGKDVEFKKGATYWTNVCAKTALLQSSRFLIENAQMTFVDSEINQKAGTFEVKANSHLKGNLSALWVENGDVKNNGFWELAIDNYCISGSNAIPPNYLSSNEFCTSISSFFEACICNP